MLSKDKFPQDALPMSDDQITWDVLHVVFDHLVPEEYENPDVMQLDIGFDTTLHQRVSKSARARVNAKVRDRNSIGRWSW
jgi:hypothetical protein